MKDQTKQVDSKETFEARVIANYGDPGVQIDTHFDILSRFVICVIDSKFEKSNYACNRVPTKNRNAGMFVAVLRPKTTWISVEGAIPTNGDASALKRRDFYGNINIGSFSSFSAKSIGQINKPYFLGQKISIRKLTKPLYANDEVFTSAFSHDGSNPLFTFTAGNMSYSAAYYSEGLPDAYITSQNAEQQTRLKAIKPNQDFGGYDYPTEGVPKSAIAITNTNTYFLRFQKHQYELAMRKINSSNSSALSATTALFQNGTYAAKSKIDADGGYYFTGDTTEFLIPVIEYEDISSNSRTSNTECMPLVIATPNSFPTPSKREIGTIVYNPTYAQIQVP